MTGGTQIYDPVKKKMIMEFPLKRKYVDSIYAYFRKHNIAIHAFDGITDKPFHGEQKGNRTMSMYVPEIDTLEADETIKDLQKILDVNIYKIPSWTPGVMSLDITAKEASKLHGIVEVAKILNIQTHEMIGVGGRIQ